MTIMARHNNLVIDVNEGEMETVKGGIETVDEWENGIDEFVLTQDELLEAVANEPELAAYVAKHPFGFLMKQLGLMNECHRIK